MAANTEVLHLVPLPDVPPAAIAPHADPHIDSLRKQLANAIAQRNLFQFQAEQSKAIVEAQTDEIRQLRALVAKRRAAVQ